MCAVSKYLPYNLALLLASSLPSICSLLNYLSLSLSSLPAQLASKFLLLLLLLVLLVSLSHFLLLAALAIVRELN